MYNPQGNKKTFDLTKGGEGAAFLMKRGLKRDRANYVNSLLRFKGELDQLRRMSTDVDVKAEIESMSGFVTETIELMYTLESMDGKGGAA